MGGFELKEIFAFVPTVLPQISGSVIENYQNYKTNTVTGGSQGAPSKIDPIALINDFFALCLAIDTTHQ